MTAPTFLQSLLSLSIALCLPLLSSAQVEDDVPQMHISWRAISIDQTIRDLQFGASSESAQRVFIPNGALSPTYEYNGPRPMHFYKIENVSGQDISVPVASVSVNPEIREALLLVRTTEQKVQIQAMPLALNELENGNSRLINLASKTIAGFHNGERFQLVPMESIILPFDTSEKNGVIKVSIQVATAGDDGWQPEINSSFGVTSEMCINLLFTLTEDERVEMIPLRERLRTASKPNQH